MLENNGKRYLVRVKTKIELISEGWKLDREGDLIQKSKSSSVVDSMYKYCGKVLFAKKYSDDLYTLLVDDVGFEWHKSSLDFNVSKLARILYG